MNVSLANFERILESGDAVYKNKPIRQPGQDISTLPTYTIPEAASFLAISTRGLFDWYKGSTPVLRPSGWLGDIALLSFRDLEEAYKVHILRSKERMSLQYLRKAMTDAREEFGSEHPLLDKNVDVFLKKLVMNIPGRGRRPRRSIALGSPETSTYIPQVIKAWGERIVTDRRGKTTIYPWRYFSEEARKKLCPVSMNPEVMSGRLVVTGTRIPVRLLWARRKSGEESKAIAKDYRISTELVENALRHIDKDAEKAA